MPRPSSQHHIWIARPDPADLCQEQILPVDWNGIVRRGRAVTNYQVLPGDRIYIQADSLVTVDNSATAVYKGCAAAVTPDGPRFFAANFKAGTVDVFDTSWKPVATSGGFVDPKTKQRVFSYAHPLFWAPFTLVGDGG